jgi:hypothetical protein
MLHVILGINMVNLYHHMTHKNTWCKWDNIVTINVCYIGNNRLLCNFIPTMKVVLGLVFFYICNNYYFFLQILTLW